MSVISVSLIFHGVGQMSKFELRCFCTNKVVFLLCPQRPAPTTPPPKKNRVKVSVEIKVEPLTYHPLFSFLVTQKRPKKGVLEWMS